MNRYVAERKWKNFGYNISDYFYEKTKGLFVTPPPKIIIPKHFSDRVLDRFLVTEHHIIETMFYHLINYNLCEFLYWYKSKQYKTLDIVISRFRVTLDRSSKNNIIARTIWNNDIVQSSSNDKTIMTIVLKTQNK